MGEPKEGKMANKWVLILIATGLWANAVVALVGPVRADVQDDLSDMAHDIHAIYNGTCLNDRLC